MTPPTPPPAFNCVGFGSALAVVAPSPAAGIAGTVFELEGSGYYNRTSGPLGSFTIWMASYAGGSVLQLTTVPAGAPEDFYVNVTVPSKNATTPFVPGAYEFWSLENYTPNATCANAPFTLTGVPPSFIGCQSWSASLSVSSPSPASGAVGSTVELQGRGFSTTGTTSIYWADPNGSSHFLLSAPEASGSAGEFNATVSVPTGYTPGSYVFWGVDDVSDCAGAGFVLTGSSSPVLKLDLPAGEPGSVVIATGSNFGADVTVAFTFDGRSVVSTCSTNGTGSFPAATGTSCTFTVPGVPNGDDGGQNVVATDADSNRASTSFAVTPAITLTPDEGPVGTAFTVTGTGFSPYPSAAVVYFDGQLITPTGGSDCAYNANPLITLDASGGFVCTYTVPAWATSGVNLVQGDDTNTSELTVAQQWTVPGQGGSGGGTCPAGSGTWGALVSFFTSLPAAEQAALIAVIVTLLVGLGYALGAGSAGGAAGAGGAGAGGGGSGNTSLEAQAIAGASSANTGATQGAVSGAGSASSTANAATSNVKNANASALEAQEATEANEPWAGGSGGSGN